MGLVSECVITSCRHQQVPMDGSDWGEHRQRSTHHRVRLLHAPGGISGGPRGFAYPTQLSHVQNVLLQVWPGLHRARYVWVWVWFGIKWLCCVGKPSGYDRVRNAEIGNKVSSSPHNPGAPCCDN